MRNRRKNEPALSDRLLELRFAETGVWPFFSAPRARDRSAQANGLGDESRSDSRPEGPVQILSPRHNARRRRPDGVPESAGILLEMSSSDGALPGL